jgi:hypothetical protein
MKTPTLIRIVDAIWNFKRTFNDWKRKKLTENCLKPALWLSFVREKLMEELCEGKFRLLKA